MLRAQRCASCGRASRDFTREELAKPTGHRYCNLCAGRRSEMGSNSAVVEEQLHEQQHLPEKQQRNLKVLTGEIHDIESGQRDLDAHTRELANDLKDITHEVAHRPRWPKSPELDPDHQSPAQQKENLKTFAQDLHEIETKERGLQSHADELAQELHGIDRDAEEHFHHLRELREKKLEEEDERHHKLRLAKQLLEEGEANELHLKLELQAVQSENAKLRETIASLME